MVITNAMRVDLIAQKACVEQEEQKAEGRTFESTNINGWEFNSGICLDSSSLPKLFALCPVKSNQFFSV